MYISKIIINNFRTIERLEFRPSKKINVLIGPNNIGKSTILNAMNLLLNPYYSIYRYDSLNELDFYNKNIDSPIEIEVWISCEEQDCQGCANRKQSIEINENEKEIFCPFQQYTLYFDPSNDVFLDAETINEANDFEQLVRVKASIDWDENNPGFIDPKYEFLNEIGENFGDFTRKHKHWLGFRYINNENEFSENEIRLTSRSMISKLIDRTEIANKLKSFFETNRKELDLMDIDSVEKLLKSFNEMLGDWNNEQYELLMELPAESIMDLLPNMGLNFKMDDLDQSFPLTRAGDGFKKIIGFILLKTVIEENLYTNMIIAMEEPEANLDPSNQRWLLKRLMENTKNNLNSQLFFTTHSLDILTAVKNIENIKVCRKNINNNINIKTIELEEEYQIRKKPFRLRKILSSLYAKKIIILEGDSEEGAYPVFFDCIANKKGEDLDIYSIEFVNGAGNNAGELIDLYKKHNIPMILFLDNDKENSLEEAQNYFEKDFVEQVLLLPEKWAFEKLIAKTINSKIEASDQGQVIIELLNDSGFVRKDGTIGKDKIKNKGLINEEFDAYDECEQRYYINIEDLGRFFKDKPGIFAEKNLINFFKDNFKNIVLGRSIALQMEKFEAIPEILEDAYEFLNQSIIGEIPEGIYILDEDGGFSEYE